LPFECNLQRYTEALGIRSPRESFDPTADNFSRDRGSYQKEPEHP
jgi:hypothetical protein